MECGERVGECFGCQAIGSIIGFALPGEFDESGVLTLGDSGGSQTDALEAGCGEGCQSIGVLGRDRFEERGSETAFDFECRVFGSPDVTLPGFVEHD